MKLFAPSPILFLAAACLMVPLDSAYSQSKVREKAQLTVSILLEPTASAPVGATATGEISVTRLNRVETASLKLVTSGLPAGTYMLDAGLDDLSEVSLGSISVVGAAPAEPAVQETVEIDLPAGLLALDIANLSVSNDAGVALFSGTAVATTTSWRFFANVRVTAPSLDPASAPEEDVNGAKPKKAKRVHGHVVVNSRISNDVETKRHFLWVAHGAPAATELKILVDGIGVGFVTSTKQGKVMFKDLESVELLPAVRNISLVDAVTGTVIMEANF